jgi:hypothetical protein
VSRPVSRRSLLAAGAGLAVAAACGKEDKERAAAPTGRPAGELVVLNASYQLVVGRDQRVALGVLRGQEPLRGEVVQLAFGREPGKLGPAQPAAFHADGIEERPYYRATHRFDSPGYWVVEASVGATKGEAVLQVVDPATSKVPLPGQRMVPVATPTTADPQGVDPICTRNPQCPLHEVSVDAALGEGRPLAVLFSTPALCRSQVCGPVLEVLLRETPAVAERVRLVHVEVYRSLKDTVTAADLTDGMRAYNLSFEPVLFLAGRDGVVRERLDGPFDRSEAREALGRLAVG